MTLYTGGSDGFVTSAAAPIATEWSEPVLGRDLHPQLISAFHGAGIIRVKGHVPEDLLDTICAVHAGEKRILPDIATELADHATDDALTEREIDVLRLIAGSGKQ